MKQFPDIFLIGSGTYLQWKIFSIVVYREQETFLFVFFFQLMHPKNAFSCLQNLPWYTFASGLTYHIRKEKNFRKKSSHYKIFQIPFHEIVWFSLGRF